MGRAELPSGWWLCLEMACSYTTNTPSSHVHAELTIQGSPLGKFCRQCNTIALMPDCFAQESSLSVNCIFRSLVPGATRLRGGRLSRSAAWCAGHRRWPPPLSPALQTCTGHVMGNATLEPRLSGFITSDVALLKIRRPHAVFCYHSQTSWLLLCIRFT